MFGIVFENRGTLSSRIIGGSVWVPGYPENEWVILNRRNVWVKLWWGFVFCTLIPWVSVWNWPLPSWHCLRHVWVRRRFGDDMVTPWFTMRWGGKDDMLHYGNTLRTIWLLGMCSLVPVVTHVSLCFLYGFYVCCGHSLEYVYDIVMLMLCIWKAVFSLIVLYPRVFGWIRG